MAGVLAEPLPSGLWASDLTSSRLSLFLSVKWVQCLPHGLSVGTDWLGPAVSTWQGGEEPLPSPGGQGDRREEGVSSGSAAQREPGSQGRGR